MSFSELEEEGVRVTVNVFESAEFGVHVKKEDGSATSHLSWNSPVSRSDQYDSL